MKHKITWALVADGGKAFALADPERRYEFRPVPGFVFEGPHKLDRDIGTDRPSRVFQGPGSPNRSTTAEIDNLARAEERRFLASVADKLASVHDKGAFDRLVLVLPPEALGCMRLALKNRLADTIVAEIHADLVKMPVERIGPYIVEHLQP